MTLNEIYEEVDAVYDIYEQDLGIYLQMELDRSYVASVIRWRYDDGFAVDGIIEECRAMIISAADEAALYRSGEQTYEDG
jgi:hypothetical protein